MELYVVEAVATRIAHLQARLARLQRRADFKAEIKKVYQTSVRQVLDGDRVDPRVNRKRFLSFASRLVQVIQKASAEVEGNNLPDVDHLMRSISLWVYDMFWELGRMSATKQMESTGPQQQK